MVSKAEYEALAEFRYGLRRFLRFSEQKALAEGLTVKQHLALLAIKGFPDRELLTVSELSERLQIHHHSTVGLINRLSAEDLIVRQQDPSDRRQVYIALSEKGNAVLERLSAATSEELRKIGPELSQILRRLKVEEGK